VTANPPSRPPAIDPKRTLVTNGWLQAQAKLGFTIKRIVGHLATRCHQHFSSCWLLLPCFVWPFWSG
jgi:hypothetical protein